MTVNGGPGSSPRARSRSLRCPFAALRLRRSGRDEKGDERRASCEAPPGEWGAGPL